LYGITYVQKLKYVLYIVAVKTMSGRGGGRGGANLTAAQIQALVNEQVAAALAAHPGGKTTKPIPL
jgi:hypothetical protein